MLTCSSCCVTVTLTRGSPTLGHLTNFCTNFYKFFNFGKFVKICEFFAEVTNSRSMVWLITPPYERRRAPIRVGIVGMYKSKAAKLGPRKGLKSPPGEHLVQPNTSSVGDISRASEPVWSQAWLDTSTPSKLLLGARYSLSSTMLNRGKFIVFC